MSRPRDRIPAYVIPTCLRECWYLDRVVNMMEEGVDIAVRIGELPDSSMQAVQVGRVRRVICASPDYLAQHGIPRTPDDLLRTKSSLPVRWRRAPNGD